jgi:hypothetical protein
MYFSMSLRLALLGLLLGVPCGAETVNNVAIIGSYLDSRQDRSWTSTLGIPLEVLLASHIDLRLDIY